MSHYNEKEEDSLDKLFLSIDEFGRVLSEVVSNIEEYYIATEDLKLSGHNILYLYLSREDLDRGILLFLYVNPYTEEVYGFGFMIIYSCSTGESRDVSFEEVSKLAERLGGYVASFHNCSIIIKEPKPNKNFIDQLREIISSVNNREISGKLYIINYSYDLLEELTEIYIRRE
ncbi:MAG: hypothetical protein ACP5GI_03640 [Sulfolobales archaeon]